MGKSHSFSALETAGEVDESLLGTDAVTSAAFPGPGLAFESDDVWMGSQESRDQVPWHELAKQDTAFLFVTFPAAAGVTGDLIPKGFYP